MDYNSVLMLNLIFDRLWKDGINPFGNPETLRQALAEDKDFEEEVFEVTKGDYRTTIVCKFNEKGFLISHSSISEPIIDESMIVLKTNLTQALDMEDYDEALRIQGIINRKRQGDEEKPTL